MQQATADICNALRAMQQFNADLKGIGIEKPELNAELVKVELSRNVSMQGKTVNQFAIYLVAAHAHLIAATATFLTQTRPFAEIKTFWIKQSAAD